MDWQNILEPSVVSFERKITFPKKTAGTQLYQQVEEQSDLCDVRIRVGSWERRYHWCVLITSPFFEAVYRNNLAERKTGVVTLGIGSPSSVEMVLRYMYDQDIIITTPTAHAILEVADFLLVDAVKVACIDYFTELDVDKDNFSNLEKISTLLNFNILALNRFWHNYLLDIIDRPELMDLEKEALENILKEKSNSCIARELFELLVNWVKFSEHDRMEHFADLFLCLDISSIDPKYMDEKMRTNPLLLMNVTCLLKLDDYRWQGDELVTVLVIKTNYMLYGMFPDENRWVHLAGPLPFTDVWACEYGRMDQMYALSTDRRKLHTCHLGSDTCDTQFIPSHVKLIKLLCVGGQLYGIAQESRHLSYKYANTLYQIELGEGESVDPRPMFSFQHEISSSCCVGESKLFFLSSIKTLSVFVYDTITCVLRCISVPHYQRSVAIGNIASNGADGCYISVTRNNNGTFCTITDTDNMFKEQVRHKWLEVVDTNTDKVMSPQLKIGSVASFDNGSGSLYGLEFCKSENLIISVLLNKVNILDTKTTTSSDWQSIKLPSGIQSSFCTKSREVKMLKKHTHCHIDCPHERKRGANAIKFNDSYNFDDLCFARERDYFPDGDMEDDNDYDDDDSDMDSSPYDHYESDVYNGGYDFEFGFDDCNDFEDDEDDDEL